MVAPYVFCAHAHHDSAQVSGESSRESVDAGCRRLTASWVRERKVSSAAEGRDTGDELCDYFEDLERAGTGAVVPPGVYTVRSHQGISHQMRKLSSVCSSHRLSCKTCAHSGASASGVPTF